MTVFGFHLFFADTTNTSATNDHYADVFGNCALLIPRSWSLNQFLSNKTRRCQALLVSKSSMARNVTEPVTLGGWGALCSNGNAFVRETR